MNDRHFQGGLLLFGLLNAALDITNGVEVFGEFAAVALAEPRLQAIHAAFDKVEKASALSESGHPRGGIRTIAVAEEALEQDARVHVHRVGSSGTAPGDGIGVRAAITGIAAAAAVIRSRTR
jgi:hypothetical protein